MTSARARADRVENDACHLDAFGPGVAERFMRFVPIGDGCWDWSGATARNGYGVFQLGVGRREYAHRVAFQMFTGPIACGLVVRHRCDNRRCVRPDHLEVGTAKDNVRDMFERGRAHVTSGESHPNAKLTDDDVRDIRRLAASGQTQRRIAHTFGVNPSAVSAIVRRARWAHVHDHKVSR